MTQRASGRGKGAQRCTFCGPRECVGGRGEEEPSRRSEGQRQLGIPDTVREAPPGGEEAWELSPVNRGGRQAALCGAHGKGFWTEGPSRRTVKQLVWPQPSKGTRRAQKSLGPDQEATGLWSCLGRSWFIPVAPAQPSTMSWAPPRYPRGCTQLGRTAPRRTVRCRSVPGAQR
ncbi:hypothetical protein HJG60_009659 [Phyllostomus discolor]|uniref:Uncharacterized protein n=1 Tax=Phyllostomus discolor TaxID=89673 RepID=A0A834EPR1_9CHIR|nr:hypothetical protein HJG60_009659 [Phyllostomus discolor]